MKRIIEESGLKFSGQYQYDEILRIVLYVCLSLSILLPSLLLYLVQSKVLFTKGDFGILFSEKVWIYYVEYIRCNNLGLLHWPSSNELFDGYLYIERLLPRIISSYTAKLIGNWFLADGLLNLAGTIVFIRVLRSKSCKLRLDESSILLVLVGVSIYNFRIMGLEGLDVYSWFSRNIVVHMTLVLSFIVLFYEKWRVRYIAVCCLLLVHSYSFMLMFLYFMFWCVMHRGYKQVVYSVIPGLIFLYLHAHNSGNSGFELFGKYYGVIDYSAFDIASNIKYIIVCAIALVFTSNAESRKTIFFLALTCFVLINVNMITGKSFQTLHFRLYIVEWIASLIVVNRLIGYLRREVSLVLHLLVVGFTILTSLSIWKSFGVMREYCGENNNMVFKLSTYSSSQVMNEKLIWDAPIIDDIKENYIELLKTTDSPMNWYSCKLHLYEE